MKCNVGNTDRIIRIILGLAIGAAGVYFKSWWGLVGIIPLATALVRFCPLYPIFRLSTNKKES